MASWILIVDDEPNIREPLARVLTLQGYQVVQAASGEEALARLQEYPIALMVLDMIMPGMSGAELMEGSRQSHPALKFLVITGQVPLDDESSAPLTPLAEYLFKPVRLQVVVETIRRMLEAAPPGKGGVSD